MISLFLNYFLTICILKKPRPRGIYLAVKIILREISPARDIHLQLELDIYLQLDRHMSLDRDRHLDCIQNFDFDDIIFVLNFEWLRLSNRRISLSAYVFLAAIAAL